MSELIERISSSTKYVCDNLKYVKINYDKIDEIVSRGSFNNNSYWLESNPFGLMDMDIRDIVNFLLVYHTVGDFCFWGDPKWEIETDIGKLDGSYAIMYILINQYKKDKNFNMSMLRFSTMLDGNVEIPLLGDRYDFLMEMNRYLKKIKGDFYDEIKDLVKDIDLLEYIVRKFYYFKDIREYNEEWIYFYKRAQLITSDILHVRKIVEGIEVDYSNLLGCADYKLPQVMRCMGMIEFSDKLELIVDNKIQLEEDSEMEIEIRAVTLEVIDYIYKKLDGKVCRMDINDYIWLLGQDKSKINKPYHRTLTTTY